MAFLSPDALQRLGLAACGSDVFISDKASIYNPAKIEIGSRVRVDDFCILAAGEGGISIGSHVHIAAYSAVIGAGRVTLEDFSGVSSRVSIYSSCDDYTGAAMTNPMVPDEYKAVDHRPVHVGRHAIIGAGTVILPGADVQEGVAVGALSLVTGTCQAFGVYSGVPARRIKERRRDLLKLEREYLGTAERKE